MEHARAVDVQDGVEAVPVPVEEELCPSPDEEVMSFTSDTVETAYKVYVCPRGNLLYMRIYLITDLKLL